MNLVKNIPISGYSYGISNNTLSTWLYKITKNKTNMNSCNLNLASLRYKVGSLKIPYERANESAFL